jgi:hypothetical protein
MSPFEKQQGDMFGRFSIICGTIGLIIDRIFPRYEDGEVDLYLFVISIFFIICGLFIMPTHRDESP